MEIKTVMIVDDNEGDQLLTEIEIKEFDPSVEIHKAYDGQEALDKLNEMEKQPDVILLDINMPHMDGLEFLKHYNKCEKKGVVVAMLTSSEQDRDKDAVLKYGFVKKYLVKLLNKVDLEELKKSA